MKMLVAAKRVPDANQRLRLRGDGTGIDDAALAFVINPFDAIAIEEALRIRERLGTGEIVVASLGRAECEETLRTALAMGADRAVHISTDETFDPWNVARLLAALVARERPELVLLGKQATDDDANQVGQFLAALLDWPQATFASRVELDAGWARVARETDAGIETVRVKLPAVVTADLRLNEPRYSSLPSLIKARKKPLERLSTASLGLVVEPRVTLSRLEIASTERVCKRVPDVADLVRCLRDEAKVL
jgi:electron transfer flavoprotein beta subunit